MRGLALAFIVALPCLAVNVSTPPNLSSSTQQHMLLRGATAGSACTIVVSTDPTFTSPATIPDFSGTEYSGASTDLGRADTQIMSDGTRDVIVGHNNADRSLVAATAYYYKTSGSGCGAATGSFVTAALGNGNSVPVPAPFNSAQPWNMDYPSVVNNSCTHAWSTDPVTGVEITPVNLPCDWTWRTGASGTGTSSIPVSGYSSMNYVGGSGWTNLTDISATSPGVPTGATTGNTNAVDLYGFASPEAFLTPWLGASVDDIGAVLWDSASMIDGTNNKYTVCVFTSPVAGCPQTPLTITVSNTSFLAHTSGSTDPDGAWPGGSYPFPTAFLRGWNWTTQLGPDHMNIQGSGLSCASGVCSLATTPTNGFGQVTANFPSTMVVGQKILIVGSSPTCTNNICTLATYTDQGHITLSESATVTSQAFIVYMWGIRITKTTATGTLTVGVSYKTAGSVAVGQAGSTGFYCAQPFTSGDGHLGQLCQMPAQSNYGGAATSVMYFIPTDGSTAIKPIYSETIPPPNSTCFTSSNANDLPYPTYQKWNYLFPDATDPKTWYTGLYDGAVAVSLWKLVYTGDTTESTYSNSYAYNYQGNGPIVSPCGSWKITNLTPSSTSKDIASQIAAHWSGTWPGSAPNYNATLFGTSWVLGSVEGHYATFNNQLGESQDAGPSWIAVLDISTSPATVVNLMFTLDGTGTTGYYGGMRWGTLHNNSAGVGNGTRFTNNILASNYSGDAFGGPWELSLTGVMKSDGTWNTTTTLPWPIDSTYLNTLPAGVTDQFQFFRYAANQYVTLRFAGQPGNVVPSSTELFNWPCPWNASYACPITLQPGDNMTDMGQAGSTGDSEHFRLVAPCTTVTGGISCTFQRNAIYDYCAPSQAAGGQAYPGSTIYNGSDTAGQFQHSNGWTPIMNPSKLNGCSSGFYWVQLDTGAVVEQSRILQGHGNLGGGSTPSLNTFLGTTTLIPNETFPAIFGLPTITQSLTGPAFAGTAGIGTNLIQSYPAAPLGQYGADTNAFNGDVGSGPELNNNSSGSVTLNSIFCTGTVYSVTTLGATLNEVNYKQLGLTGWAGRYLLHDISGPSSNICGNAASAAAWGICYVVVTGECGIMNSAVGTVFVNVPGAYSAAATCNTGESFLLTPCVVVGVPGGGGVRVLGKTGPDPTGGLTNLVTYGLTVPGEGYPYDQFTPLTPHIGLLSPHHTQNWTTMAYLVGIPPWKMDAVDRTSLVNISVPIPPGAAYARVAFGYSRFNGAAQSPGTILECTPRAENCFAGTNVSPFAFASDTYTTSGTFATGGTITVPWLAGNVGWYRIDRSPDGMTWTSGQTVPMAVQ